MEVRTAQPTQDMAHLRRLVSEQLARATLSAPANQLRLRSLETVPWGGLTTSLLPEDNKPGEKLHQLVERLTVRLGEGNVVVPLAQQDHRPECMQHWVPARDAPGAACGRAAAGAMRSIRPGCCRSRCAWRCSGKPCYQGPLRADARAAASEPRGGTAAAARAARLLRGAQRVGRPAVDLPRAAGCRARPAGTCTACMPEPVKPSHAPEETPAARAADGRMLPAYGELHCSAISASSAAPRIRRNWCGAPRPRLRGAGHHRRMLGGRRRAARTARRRRQLRLKLLPCGARVPLLTARVRLRRSRWSPSRATCRAGATCASSSPPRAARGRQGRVRVHAATSSDFTLLQDCEVLLAPGARRRRSQTALCARSAWAAAAVFAGRLWLGGRTAARCWATTCGCTRCAGGRAHRRAAGGGRRRAHARALAQAAAGRDDGRAPGQAGGRMRLRPAGQRRAPPAPARAAGRSSIRPSCWPTRWRWPSAAPSASRRSATSTRWRPCPRA